MWNTWLLTGLAALLSMIGMQSGAPTADLDGWSAPVGRDQATINLVSDAITHYDIQGRQATIDYYNTPESADGEAYVFIFDEDDKLIAHINQSLLGEDIKGDLGVDSTGYDFGDSIAAATEAGHWVDYVYLNPATGNEEYKHSFVIRHDGLIFGSGWYQVLPSTETKLAGASRDTATLAFVQEALDRYDRDGREATVEYYSSPESVVGEDYIFIFDEDDILIGHYNSDLIGEDLKGDLGVDSTGYRFGDDMARADENGHWVDYVWLNPDTGMQESKHSFVIRHDGLIFGSGWYEVLPARDDAVSMLDRDDFTIHMVMQAIEKYDTDGREATLEYYSSPESAVGEWYVFIYDEDGINIAHINHDIHGRDLHGPLGTDSAGYRVGDAVLAATEEGHWVDYLFHNPVTGNEEYKHSYVIRHDGLIFGSGWYQILPSSDDDTSLLDRDDFTIHMVMQAIEKYKNEGLNATIEYYSSDESRIGQWYVFMRDEDNVSIAHPNPAVLGTQRTDAVDLTGFPYGRSIAAATEEGHWVDYVFLNLATGKHEYKHSFVIRHDGYIFGSGWYEQVPQLADPIVDRDEFTIDIVMKAIEKYDTDGREATLEYYSSPESAVGEWYVFIYDEDGINIAHINPDIHGRDLHGPLGTDSAGYRVGDAVLAATEEGHWVDYLFHNPVTGNEEYKHSYVIRHDGLIFGSGWYQILPSEDEGRLAGASRDSTTLTLVEQALDRYDAEGLEATLAYYNSPDSVVGESYVLIFDAEDKLIAHINPDLIGEDIKGDLGVDSTGYRFGESIANATEDGHWVDYVYLNPATGNEEYKHSFVIRHDGLIFGSGWYQILPSAMMQ